MTKLKTPIAMLLLIATATITNSCHQPAAQKEKTDSVINTSERVNQPQNKRVDKTILVGEWTRTDAPYQIKIVEMFENGNINSGYYNPKSIHVGKATWSKSGDTLKVYIELRDENYPGSNYKLDYIPGKDLLAGDYFQAVEVLHTPWNLQEQNKFSGLDV